MQAAGSSVAKRPAEYAAGAVLALGTLYTVREVPRTGLVVSSASPHLTVFKPPEKYVSGYLNKVMTAKPAKKEHPSSFDELKETEKVVVVQQVVGKGEEAFERACALLNSLSFDSKQEQRKGKGPAFVFRRNSLGNKLAAVVVSKGALFWELVPMKLGFSEREETRHAMGLTAAKGGGWGGDVGFEVSIDDDGEVTLTVVMSNQRGDEGRKSGWSPSEKWARDLAVSFKKRVGEEVEELRRRAPLLSRHAEATEEERAREKETRQERQIEGAGGKRHARKE
uniref:DUF1990 domain-containing protein n=1 Tax=Chromera velia CCMP2878 TaxID=1169474 RepID=A0A0K6S6J9_9ALVE|mmetsp:Transcript_50215/g.98882  ORF Transcript_50215/g.98882 Transcript_50215/m.98882 type:complete len:281 (+) Transcript_50215:262-1104(+)|eukprot:Cvel_3260.t1-p1 / transcript=Cvel_3260.t1 / gene=Cvel_3260 / organism=Chromera_velia_CCMP2878 / gene_product=hypothetical protein / transcript_product=hypothetical protein / location=Cvel_scaffold128:29412-32242(+) / protein_length=280 / sequence_SO=supercontig / SO=protein_coding / is_pseudo=false